MRGFFGDKVYETIIPRNVRIIEAPSCKPVLLYDLACAGAQAYVHLAGEMLRRHARTNRHKSTNRVIFPLMSEPEMSDEKGRRTPVGTGLEALFGEDRTNLAATETAVTAPDGPTPGDARVNGLRIVPIGQTDFPTRCNPGGISMMRR